MKKYIPYILIIAIMTIDWRDPLLSFVSNINNSPYVPMIISLCVHLLLGFLLSQIVRATRRASINPAVYILALLAFLVAFSRLGDAVITIKHAAFLSYFIENAYLGQIVLGYLIGLFVNRLKR
jgi:phosphoglycerol transferase MdoB-like AlkP superfamily enzyme